MRVGSLNWIRDDALSEINSELSTVLAFVANRAASGTYGLGERRWRAQYLGIQANAGQRLIAADSLAQRP